MKDIIKHILSVHFYSIINVVFYIFLSSSILSELFNLNDFLSMPVLRLKS